jgi:hypothetical protein
MCLFGYRQMVPSNDALYRTYIDTVLRAQVYTSFLR